MPGGLGRTGLVAILTRTVLVTVVAIMGAVAIVAVMTIAAAVSALLAIVALRPAIVPVAGIFLVRVMGGPLSGAAVGGGDRHADQPFDIAQERRFFVIAERNRHAGGAGARGAADAVDVRFRGCSADRN